MAAVLALAGAAFVRVWDSVAPIGEAAGSRQQAADAAPVRVQAQIGAGPVARVSLVRPVTEQ